MCGKPKHRRLYLYLARTRRRSPSRGSSPHKTAQEKSGFCLLALHLLDNVGITRIGDRQAADPEVLTASGTQVDVGSRVVVDSGLAKHGVVLDLALPHWRNVVADENELGLAAAQALEHGLVAQGVLAALHDERKATVDVILSLLRLLGHGAFPFFFFKLLPSLLLRRGHLHNALRFLFVDPH